MSRREKNKCRATVGWSHRDHSLQANVEVLFLAKLELLQCHSCLPNELVVTKLVLVTNWEPVDRRVWIHFCCTQAHRRAVGYVLFSPQGFARHLLVTDAVVDQRLVPQRVQSVLQGLGAKLVGLQRNVRNTHVLLWFWNTQQGKQGCCSSFSQKCLADIGGQRSG